MGYYTGLGIDFNYFLYSSPTQEVRDSNEELLIETYYKSFANTLRQKNFDESRIPTMQDVKNEIKAYEFYGEVSFKCFNPNKTYLKLFCRNFFSGRYFANHFYGEK